MVTTCSGVGEGLLALSDLPELEVHVAFERTSLH